MTTDNHDFWRNKQGRVVIWQRPNLPLTLWFVCMVFARLVSFGRLHAGFSFLSAAALFAWAYLEITAGDSPFRRVLGAVVMAGLVVSHFR